MRGAASHQRAMAALLWALVFSAAYALAQGPAPAQPLRIQAAFAAAMGAPGVREAMARRGNAFHPASPDAAVAFFRSEHDQSAQLVGSPASSSTETLVAA